MSRFDQWVGGLALLATGVIAGLLVAPYRPRQPESDAEAPPNYSHMQAVTDGSQDGRLDAHYKMIEELRDRVNGVQMEQHQQGRKPTGAK